METDVSQENPEEIRLSVSISVPGIDKAISPPPSDDAHPKHSNISIDLSVLDTGMDKLYPDVMGESKSPYHSLNTSKALDHNLMDDMVVIEMPKDEKGSNYNYNKVYLYLNSLDRTAALFEKILHLVSAYYPQAFDPHTPRYRFEIEQIRFLTVQMNIESYNLTSEQIHEVVDMVSLKQKQSQGKTLISSDIVEVLRTIACSSLESMREEIVSLKLSAANLEQQSLVKDLKLQREMKKHEEEKIRNSLVVTPSTCVTIPQDSVATKQSIEKSIKLLGDNVNKPMNDFGDTLLHAISYYGEIANAKWFLTQKSPLVHVLNARHETPLDVAIKAQNIMMAITLIGHGALPSLEMRNTLVRHLLTADDKKLKSASLKRCLNLTKESKINNVDSYQMTPLHWAVILHMDKSVKWIVNVPNVKSQERDKFGRTPMMCAASCGNDEAMKILSLTVNLNLTVQDLKGNTALHHYLRYMLSWEHNHVENTFESPYKILFTEFIMNIFKISNSSIPEIVVYNAAKIDKTSLYHQLIASFMNYIAHRDDVMEILMSPDPSIFMQTMNLDDSLLEGFVDQVTIKRYLCIILRNRIKHPQFYVGPVTRQIHRSVGCALKLHCLTLLGNSEKESKWCLQVNEYGRPNKNEKQFDMIQAAGGRIFFIDGVSVLQLVNDYNKMLIRDAHSGVVSKAKKDSRWNSGAHYALRNSPNNVVVVKYGPSFKKLSVTTLKMQIVGNDYAQYHFTDNDIESWRDITKPVWVKDAQGFTPVQLAQERARHLSSIGFSSKHHTFGM
ncbi:hypothetical protein AKO1_015739 [Acrasis kona]|uniref:Uncharacterized protein n=1 Tax=Acrasis kona TaxID=1008807 RepID=A0AAW2ZHX3_9EUKA